MLHTEIGTKTDVKIRIKVKEEECAMMHTIYCFSTEFFLFPTTFCHIPHFSPLHKIQQKKKLKSITIIVRIMKIKFCFHTKRNFGFSYKFDVVCF